jgi:hypothetical protein
MRANTIATCLVSVGAVVLVAGVFSVAILSMQGKIKEYNEALPIPLVGLVLLASGIFVRAKYGD